MLNELTDADGYPVRLLKAVAYVVPLGLSNIILEHCEQMEHDALHKGVPHLALGAVCSTVKSGSCDTTA